MVLTWHPWRGSSGLPDLVLSLCYLPGSLPRAHFLLGFAVDFFMFRTAIASNEQHSAEIASARKAAEEDATQDCEDIMRRLGSELIPPLTHDLEWTRTDGYTAAFSRLH